MARGNGAAKPDTAVEELKHVQRKQQEEIYALQRDEIAMRKLQNDVAEMEGILTAILHGVSALAAVVDQYLKK